MQTGPMRWRSLALAASLVSATYGCAKKAPEVPVTVDGRSLTEDEQRELREWSEDQEGKGRAAGEQPIVVGKASATSVRRGRSAAVAVGITMVSMGAAGLFFGGIAALVGSHLYHEETEIGGLAAVGGGGLLLVVGIPVLVYGKGSGRGKAGVEPFVFVGPGSVQVGGPF